MTSAPGQPRVQVGVPHGGQFTGASQDEPKEVTLLSDRRWDRYNATGTFEFPPRPVCADQVIDFWLHVPIPDVILAQYQRAYPTVREQVATAMVDGDMADDVRPERHTILGGKEFRRRLAEWEHRHEDCRGRMETLIGPQSLRAHEVRTAVILTQAFKQSADLETAECAALTDVQTSVRLPGDDKGLPLSAAVRYLCGSSMPEWVFVDPGHELVERVDELSRTMHQVSAKLDELHDETALDIATRGARTQEEYDAAAKVAGFVPR